MMGVKGEALDSLFLSSPSSASLLGSGGRKGAAKVTRRAPPQP